MVNVAKRNEMSVIHSLPECSLDSQWMIRDRKSPVDSHDCDLKNSQEKVTSVKLRRIEPANLNPPARLSNWYLVSVIFFLVNHL